jgi:rRNA-processing protein FCF1
METDLFKSSHDDEIPMEIGLNDEQAIIAELHSCRVNLQPGLPTSNDSQFCGLPVETSCVNYSDFLYIILDTNVLLSHLKFLIELKDHSLKDVGKPVLVIPWIVIQELDVLKSSSDGLGKQARIAGQFIHDSLTSHHPRVRGQTIEEVNTEVNNLSISNNDDRILHCCLVYQYKTKLQAEPGIVILFSNDTMLCAKAKINAIVSCSRKTLMSQLKSLTINRGPISYAQTHGNND